MKTRRLTKGQQAWCTLYQNATGFDPLMDDYFAGNVTFLDAAKKSIRWFEDWAGDVCHEISREYPLRRVAARKGEK